MKAYRLQMDTFILMNSSGRAISEKTTWWTRSFMSRKVYEPLMRLVGPQAGMIRGDIFHLSELTEVMD